MVVVEKSLSGSLFEKTRPILGRPKIAARLVAILASYPGCENRHPHAFLKATPPSDFFTTSFRKIMRLFHRSTGFALLLLSSFPLQEMLIQADLEPNRKIQKRLAQSAIAEADRCLKIDPNMIGCLYYKTQATGLSNRSFFGYKKRVRQMIADWEKVIAIDPTFDYGGPYRMIAEVYMELPRHFGPKDLRQDLNKAVAYLKKAVAISDYPTNTLDLAEAYLQLKNKEAAQKTLEKAKLSLPRWRQDPYYPDWKIRVAFLSTL